MEANKIKEEIFKKFFHPVTEEDRILKRSIFDFAEEYANQLLLELEQEKIMLERYCSKYESELSELKEKRKEEIEKAYKDGRISMISSSSEVAFMTPEQYYTQTYGQ